MVGIIFMIELYMHSLLTNIEFLTKSNRKLTCIPNIIPPYSFVSYIYRFEIARALSVERVNTIRRVISEQIGRARDKEGEREGEKAREEWRQFLLDLVSTGLRSKWEIRLVRGVSLRTPVFEAFSGRWCGSTTTFLVSLRRGRDILLACSRYTGHMLYATWWYSRDFSTRSQRRRTTTTPSPAMSPPSP